MKTVASIAVIYDDSYILMGRRQDNGKWTNPGGHIEAYETPELGALRELREETGLVGLQLQPAGKPVEVTTPTGSVLVHPFVHRTVKAFWATKDSDPDREVHSWQWLPIPIARDVLQNLHSPQNVLLRAVGLQRVPDPVVHRMDSDYDKLIRDAIERAARRLEQEFPSAHIASWAEGMVASMDRLTKGNASTQVGLSVGRMDASDSDLKFLQKLSPELREFLENRVQENVGLIRSIPKRRLVSLQNAVLASINSDERVETLAQTLNRQFKLAENDARLIARDQIGKLGGQLTQFRLKELGIKKYIWRTALDERVRPDHERLEGKVCSWNRPPIINRSTGLRGHPGDDYQCRCVAEPVAEAE